MPRFFFDVIDSLSVADRDGVVCKDVNAARVFALRYAGEVLQSEATRVQSEKDWAVRVSDGQGAHLFEIRLRIVDQ